MSWAGCTRGHHAEHSGLAPSGLDNGWGPEPGGVGRCPGPHPRRVCRLPSSYQNTCSCQWGLWWVHAASVLANAEFGPCSEYCTLDVPEHTGVDTIREDEF